MENNEGVTTPPTLDSVLTAMAETLRAAGYTVNEPDDLLPKEIKDRDGDIWYLCQDRQTYSLSPWPRTNPPWTLTFLQDPGNGLAPLTVIK